MKKRRILLFIIVIAALFAMTSCKREETAADVELLEPAISTQELCEVKYRTICNVSKYDFYAVPYMEELSFAKDGRFGEYIFCMGEAVKKGDVLANTYQKDASLEIEDLQKQLSDSIMNEEYDLATAQNNLDIAYEEIGVLYDNKQALQPGLASSVDIQNQYIQLEETIIRKEGSINQLKLQLTQIKETAQLEQQQLNDRITQLQQQQQSVVIKAPFDGVITQEAQLYPGDYFSTRDKIIVVSDYSKIFLKGPQISSFEIENAEKIFAVIDGKRYDVTYQPVSAEEVQAMIAKGETPVSTFTFEDKEGTVTVGDYAMICVNSVYRQDVLSIPTDSIVKENEKYYVMVSGAEGKERREVEIGANDTYYTEILSGLKEGEIVYVTE